MKQKRLFWILGLTILIVAIIAGVYLFWQQTQHSKTQANLLKTANSAYGNDPHYVSFGADYVFAVPKSFVVDETTVTGVQLIVPYGSNLKVNKLDELYDAAVVAVQPINKDQVKPYDNGGLRSFINKSLLPDLKTIGDASVAFSMPGNYESATINVKKNGKQVRQVFAYGGQHPLVVVSKEKSDAFVEIVNSILSVGDAKSKDDINSASQVIKDGLSLLQQGQVQQLYDRASANFRKQTNPTDLAKAVAAEASYIHRDITVAGGIILGNQFSSQIYFPPLNKGEQASLGYITLHKEDGQLKLDSLNLPVNAPAPKE